MLSSEDKKLAQWAMEYALKNGCQQVQVNLYSGTSSSYGFRDAKLETLQQASEGGMTLMLFVDGRYGTYSTNRLDKKELASFISNSIDATKYLAEDKARALPGRERCYRGGKPDLKLYDSDFDNHNPEEKMAMAQAVAEEVIGADPRIISVQSSYGDGAIFQYRLNSNGFEGESENSSFSLSASVSVKGVGEARPSSYWYESSLFFDKLKRENIGKRALERTLRKIGQQKVKSGAYTMVLDPMSSSQLLNPMISAIFGSALQQKNSFLIDRLDSQVGSKLLTLIDEPHIVGANGSRYFDREGVATERRPVFEEGVLKTYFIDSYNGAKMGVNPTISTPSALVMQPGDKELKQLIGDISNGILVTDFNGGNCNSSTGDFSYGIEGFLIKDGKLDLPISEMNITGNMITLWAALSAVGNDALQNRSWRIPSLVFDNVAFSGL